MKQVETVAALRSLVKSWPGKVALVPTMGNLHEGHLRLVREARKLADHVVVTIFVNPMQFSGGEELDSYPRTMQEDCERLVEEQVDLLFAPEVAEVYPRDMSIHTKVEVPGISDLFCGASRPGHFVGVATVVCKLFNMVQPHIAVFGKKDFQQLMVIRRMVADLAIPVTIVGIDTVREDDGLAMSSRNNYLTEVERAKAGVIFQTMNEVAREMRAGRRAFAALEAEAKEKVSAGGLKPDYFSIRRAEDLMAPGEDDTQLVILAAAYLGKTRLIDNLEVALETT